MLHRAPQPLGMSWSDAFQNGLYAFFDAIGQDDKNHGCEYQHNAYAFRCCERFTEDTYAYNNGCDRFQGSQDGGLSGLPEGRGSLPVPDHEESGESERALRTERGRG